VVGLGLVVRGHADSECWVNAPAVVIMLHGWAAAFQAIPSAIGLIQSPLGSRACRVIGRNLAGTGIGQRHGGGGGYYLGVPTGRITPCRPGCQFLMRSTKKRFASARLYPVGSPPPVELANRGSWCGRRRTGARGCRAGRENRGFWRPFPARIPWSGGIGGDLAGFGNLVRRADRVAIRAGIRARGRFAREIFWKLFDQRILSAVKSQEKTRKHAHFCELEKFHVRIGAARSIKRYGTGQTRT
jgi:hypothetical protein